MTITAKRPHLRVIFRDPFLKGKFTAKIIGYNKTDILRVTIGTPFLNRYGTAVPFWRQTTTLVPGKNDVDWLVPKKGPAVLK